MRGKAGRLLNAPPLKSSVNPVLPQNVINTEHSQITAPHSFTPLSYFFVLFVISIRDYRRGKVHP